jgi:uncharacterized radical SAM protein YgiQ
MGEVRAQETIKFSVTGHRGCFGECNFCSITAHQGTSVVSRSEDSIVRETESIVKLKGFKGYITDVGGPTANMYGMECEKEKNEGKCRAKRCVFPAICAGLKVDHSRQVRLLKRLEKLPGVKKVFVASGLRHDLVLHDKKHGDEYMREIAAGHVSGRLKLAPEHSDNNVLKLMGKPPAGLTAEFKRRFDAASRAAGKEQYLAYYFLAAHPGCGLESMKELKEFAKKELRTRPEQVQVFMPTPSTYSSLMYHTGIDPFTGSAVFVERGLKGKAAQKEEITGEIRNKHAKNPVQL